jgi:Ser/Thr protein kinase RdoA (MazF antagonist)
MTKQRESPRPTPSPELFDAIQTSYGLEFTEAPMDLGGSRNLNLLVVTKEQRYVVRVYRSWVTAHRVADMQRVRRLLSCGGIPSSVVVPTLAGTSWTTHEGCVLEMEEYVESDAYMDSWERLTVGLPWLGRTHNLLKKAEVSWAGKHPPIANHITPEEALTWTRRAVRRIEQWGPTAQEARFASAALELAHRLSVLEHELVKHLPHQLVHGDFWDNNILFRNGEIVLITDLDFMGERARIDDVALTLYYTNSTFAEDPLSDERIQRLRDLLEAYASGLDEPLTAVERLALPLAIARTPLFLMRYLTLMETKEAAVKPMAVTLPDLEWALQTLTNLAHWQQKLT